MNGGRARAAWAIAREIAIGGLAGILGGILVVGIGGRLFMRVAALIDPEAIGRTTSSGAIVGRITLDGSMAFVLFEGLGFGVLAGIVWVVVSPWLPGSGPARFGSAALAATLLGGILIVQADEIDFLIVRPTALVVALLLVLIAAMGAAVAGIDRWLRGRMPGADAGRGWRTGYAVLFAIGLTMLPLVVSFYFGHGAGLRSPPWAVGLAIVVTGVLTAVGWALRVRAPASPPPAGLVISGRTALLAAAALGGARLLAETGALLGAGG